MLNFLFQKETTITLEFLKKRGANERFIVYFEFLGRKEWDVVELVQQCIKDDNIYFTFLFKNAKLTLEQHKKLLDIVSAKALYCLWFAEEIKTTKKEKDQLINVLSNQRSEWTAYYFAKNVKGLTKKHIDKLCQIVIDGQSALFCSLFLREIKGLTLE